MKEYKTSDEFMLLNNSFNSMLSQIEQLKIEVYEEQIEKQKEELQRLQLQMNPHFFMNALNIIFSLAKIRDYNLISEMSLCLIRYFQFIFRDNLTFVKLKDEIEHTKNYLRIQELRYPEKFTFTICAPNSLSDTLVPPLFIQIFAENSIKHAVTLDESVHLSINIDCIECENVSYLKVMIEDTGKGFPVHILEKLKSNQGIENAKGEHIGISNITRRLRLLYQDHASIEFKNNKPNGAVVEMMLPLNPEITQGGMCYVPIANR